MDPELTFSRMRDDQLPIGERRQCALDLLQWLANGGFPPKGPNNYTPRTIVGLAYDVLCGALDAAESAEAVAV